MRFFVYGSLKPGHERWPILEPWATKVERAYARGQLYDLGFYPGARFNAESTIPGYLIYGPYERNVLDSVDAIEGHPILFCRRAIEVQVDNGPALSCNGYEFVHAIHLNREAEIHEWKPERDAVAV